MSGQVPQSAKFWFAEVLSADIAFDSVIVISVFSSLSMINSGMSSAMISYSTISLVGFSECFLVSNQNFLTKLHAFSAGLSFFIQVISIGMDSGFKPQQVNEFFTVSESILFSTFTIVTQTWDFDNDLIFPDLCKYVR